MIELLNSLWLALNQMLTLVVLGFLLYIGLRGWFAMRRVSMDVRRLTEVLAEPEFRQRSMPELAARVGAPLDGLILDLAGRWGLKDRSDQPSRFSAASDVITSQRFFASCGDWRFVEIAPGVATSIGILGTFLGISLGLGTINFESGTDPDAVFNSVGGVVDGLATAFWTSVFGVVVSIVVNHLARRVESRADAVLATLCDALDERMPQLTPLDNQIVLRGVLRPLATLLQELSAKQDRQHALDTSRELWLKRIAIQGRRQRDAQEASLAEVRLGHATLRSLSDDLVTKLEDGFGRALGPHLDKMTSAVQTVADAGVQSAKVFVDDMVNGLQSGLTDVIEQVGSTMQDFQGRFETLTERLERSSRQQLDVLEKGEAVAERVRTRLSELDDIMGKVSGFHEAMVAIAANHAELQQQVSQSTTALVSSVGGVQEALGGQLESASEIVKAIGEELARTKELVAEFSGGFSDACGKLNDAARRLVGRVEAEEGLLQRYEETTKSLEAAMANASPVLRNVPTIVGAVGKVAMQQMAVTKALEGTPEKVEKLVSLLGERVSGMEGASESMLSATVATEEWARVATEAIREFQNGVQSVLGGVLGQFDQELSRAVTALGGVMSELEDIIEARNREPGGAG